jgi:hypothetical protein
MIAPTHNQPLIIAQGDKGFCARKFLSDCMSSTNFQNVLEVGYNFMEKSVSSATQAYIHQHCYSATQRRVPLSS